MSRRSSTESFCIAFYRGTATDAIEFFRTGICGEEESHATRPVLTEIEAITPWAELERTVAPFYPSSGGRGRPPIGVLRMLRMYVAQQCFDCRTKASKMPCTTASRFAASLASTCHGNRRRMPRRC